MQVIKVTLAGVSQSLASAGALGASFLSDAIDVSAARRLGIGATIQLDFTGSGTGDITIEGSLDDAEYAPITDATADPTDGSPILFRDIHGCNFLKVRWTRTANTLTFTAANAAGV